jgi:DNA-binding Xre family transcriptional regulator
MITVTIQAAALRRGVKNAYQLQLIAGISPAVAADLWRGKKLPRLETLDNLCEVLGCELTDLIQRNGKAHVSSTAKRSQKKRAGRGTRK